MPDHQGCYLRLRRDAAHMCQGAPCLENVGPRREACRLQLARFSWHEAEWYLPLTPRCPSPDMLAERTCQSPRPKRCITTIRHGKVTPTFLSF